MSPNPFSLIPETAIDEIAEELVKGRYRAIPIVESEKVVGIVSTADVIKYYLHKD
jgi:CBS domain-containing protein